MKNVLDRCDEKYQIKPILSISGIKNLAKEIEGQ